MARSGVGLHPRQTWWHDRAQLESLLRKRGRQTIDGNPRDLGRVGWIQDERGLTGLSARKLLQVIHQSPQAPGLIVQSRPRWRARLHHPVQQTLQIALQSSDWRAQLVRNISDQLTAPPLGGLECISHRIEASGQVAEFVVTWDGHALRVMPIGQSPARRRQPTQRTHDATRHEGGWRLRRQVPRLL